MKLLLYCTKAKPYLTRNDLPNEKGEFYKHWQLGGELDKKHLYGDTPILNGKIVAECDFEVEEITNCGTSFRIMKYDDLQENYKYTNKIARNSCLNYTDLRKYLGTNNGYAIHIKNLHIFDKPKELSEYDKYEYEIFSRNGGCLGTEWKPVEKAPQNMMYCYEEGEKSILISIQPQWLCKILNGEKTIEIRKKVLKELENV